MRGGGGQMEGTSEIERQRERERWRKGDQKCNRDTEKRERGGRRSEAGVRECERV